MEQTDRQSIIEAVLEQCADNGSEEEVRKQIYEEVGSHLQGAFMTVSEKTELASQIYNSMCGLDILQPLVDDPDITEIMVNGPDYIFIEKSGRLTKTALTFDDKDHLLRVISHCFGKANKLIHEKNPIADMHLNTGARIHAVLPPISLNGPSLTIRKFTGIKPDLDMLVRQNGLSRQAADFLIDAVKQRKNIFLCGGTGSGKTTLLNMLSAYIPENERVVTIEDTAELNLQHLPNLVRLETRMAAPDGDGEINLTNLIKAALRMRPDRIIVGEVRGREAFDMLQAMNTGHPGSLSTGHANSCRDLIDRLCLMILMAVDIPWDAVRTLVASALDLIIFLARDASGKRYIKEISEVKGINSGQFVLGTCYQANPA